MALVFIAILLLEGMYLNGYLDIENVQNELLDCVKSRECSLTNDLPDDFDFGRYHVEWCARWCVDNLMNRDRRVEMGGKLPLIKLSNDRFEARYDGNYFDLIPVRSQYSVTSGVYFYEVTLATDGKIITGWSSFDALFDEYTLANCDMSHKFICKQDGDYILLNLADCHAGDVIGCLIDLDNRRFVFYYNGKEVNGFAQNNEEVNQNQVTISSSLYYATAFLFHTQLCCFNFGQASFKFPPNHIQFIDFHKASENDVRKYGLSETSQIIGRCRSDFWFKHLPVGNKVDLVYRDTTQNECDELVKSVESDIADGREVEEIKRQFGCIRYIQAVVEEMGNGVGDDKVDVMAQWIGNVIDETIEVAEISFAENEKILAKLNEQLYPYLQLRVNFSLDLTKHRNICIVLSYLNRFSQHCDYYFIKYIRNEVFIYLTRTLTETRDAWTQLFVLVALDNLELSYDEKKMIQEDNQIMTFLNNYKDTPKYSDAFEMCTLEHCHLLSYQLHFLSECFLEHVLNHSINLNQSNQSTLNIDKSTQYLKLSRDLLSIRSDLRWESVRYDCLDENVIFYFETLLLTNGPIRIGWSTKRTDLLGGKILGADEFSISFNGHNRVVLHQNTQSTIGSIPHWKAGDVVRCLMDTPTRRFYFFLNGHPLPLPDKLYFSPLPYYPSFSLSAHQQVYCNFGQSNFRYPQPNIEHLNYILCMQKELQLSGQLYSSIDLSHSLITNSFLAINSKPKTRNITFNHQLQSNISPLNVNHANKRELTFAQSAFITCPICHKHISTKRLKLDCCEHIAYTVGPIPSTQFSSNQPANISSIEYEPLETRPSTSLICQICHDSMTNVVAGCCDHLKFCTKCGSAMGSCVAAKCNRK